MTLLVRWLRRIGLMEGVSLLLLLGVAMPLRRFADLPLAVTLAGSIHGALFLVYLAVLIRVVLVRRWSLARAGMLLLASVVPAGPFFADRHLVRWAEADELA